MVDFGLIVVSDNVLLDPSLDRITNLVKEILSKRGHRLLYVYFSSNDVHEIRRKFYSIPHEAKVILVCGGTGPSERDVSIEAIKPLMDKELKGFGELFRELSIEEVGPRAILSRSTAGRIGDKAVFILPGSPSAVKLALEKIILPEIFHLLKTIKGVSHWKLNYIYTNRDDLLTNNSFLLRLVLSKLNDEENFMIIRVKKALLSKQLKDIKELVKHLFVIESPNYMLLFIKFKKFTEVSTILRLF